MRIARTTWRAMPAVVLVAILLLPSGSAVGSAPQTAVMPVGLPSTSPTPGVPNAVAATTEAASPGANLTWTNLTPGQPNPPALAGAAMVYDPSESGVLLFGGISTHGAVNYTWLWADGAWTNLTPTLSVAPSPRYDVAMAYDTADGYVVLFGGNPGHLNDTWIFQDGKWSKVSPNPSPPGREDAGMTYDAADHYVVLFGGELQNGNYLNDTWSFAGGHWVNWTSSLAPPPREAMAMVYDGASGYVLMFGGDRVGGGHYNDTWEYIDGFWVNLTGGVGVAPESREEARMVYDPDSNLVLLFDGLHSSDALSSESVISTGAWAPLSPPTIPPARYDASMAWTPNGGTGFILLFGGTINSTASGRLNDTWGLRPALSAALSATPSALDEGQSSALVATATGGYPPLLYGWSGLPVGCPAPPGDSATCTFPTPGTFTVQVGVTDAYRDMASSPPVDVTVNARLAVSATVVPSSGTVPLVVQYGAIPTGGTAPVSYLWTFGDGSTSTSASGEATFSEPGTYVVNITVKDFTGESAGQNFTVVVAPSPAPSPPPPLVASATANRSSGSAPMSVGFSGSATGGTPPYSYAWNFGDGGLSSAQNPAHSFSSAATFTVALTVTDSLDATSVAWANVTVGPPLGASGTASASFVCESGASFQNVSFSVAVSGGTPPYAVVWDLGAGVPAATGTSVSHTYNPASSYSATATITDAQSHTLSVPVETAAGTAGACGVTSSSGSSGGLSTLDWGVIILGLAAVLAAVILLARRRKKQP
jgi:PKD repeat protein